MEGDKKHEMAFEKLNIREAPECGEEGESYIDGKGSDVWGAFTFEGYVNLTHMSFSAVKKHKEFNMFFQGEVNSTFTELKGFWGWGHGLEEGDFLIKQIE